MPRPEPKLNEEQRLYIIYRLACFDTPTKVADGVRLEYDIEVSRHLVQQHDPDKVAGRKLGAKWVAIFREARAKYINDATTIPVANRSYRIELLGEMIEAEKANPDGSKTVVAALIEQVAKETEGFWSNKARGNTRALRDEDDDGTGSNVKITGGLPEPVDEPEPAPEPEPDPT